MPQTHLKSEGTPVRAEPSDSATWLWVCRNRRLTVEERDAGLFSPGLRFVCVGSERKKTPVEFSTDAIPASC